MKMIRVADYIAQTLAQHGIRHVFLVTGGGAMHLNDAFGRCPGMQYVACHHEQGCSMAAEGYFRMSGRPAAVNVTTGPGGTNAITGVYGAWTDSLGMVVISGQVKYETLVASTDLPLRQLGDQEVDIVRIVEPITKYAQMVTDPQTVRYHVERALHLAVSGRPGPVWLDIPMNVQGAMVDADSLPGYDPREDQIVWETADLPAACRQVLDRLRQAKRPVIMPGTGIRLADCHPQFLELIERLGVPVATAFNAHDVLWNDHPLYVGRPGSVGDRAGNFAVQNSDFLLVLGCRLNIRQISYNWQAFAREAFIAMVDADAAELKKPTLQLDLPIHADLRDALPALLDIDYPGPTDAHREYLQWCQQRRERYPVVLDEYRRTEGKVNPYCFAEALFHQLDEGEIVVPGDGTAHVTTFQAAYLKPGQRLFSCSGAAPMGYDLPAAVGAAVASGAPRVICIAGDGSIQMNVQELQTIVTHRLPIKIFVYNNEGYHSIRQTQRNYFPDNIVGCGKESGLGFPDFRKLADAYGLGYHRVESHSQMADGIRATLDAPGPQICEVLLDLGQPFAPKLSSRQLENGQMVSSPLEDLAPFLDRDELAENLLIAPWEG